MLKTRDINYVCTYLFNNELLSIIISVTANLIMYIGISYIVGN